MSDTIAELFVTLGLDDQMSKGISTALTAASALTVGIFALAKAVEQPINAFNQLESAAAVTALQTGRTTEEMQALIEGLHSVDTSLEESSALFETLGKAGVDSKEDLKLLGDQFDSLGDATGKSAAALAETLLPAIKALDEDATNVNFDRLAVMFMETQVSAEEFGAAIKRIGPSLKDAGVSFEGAEAALVALDEAGIKGRLGISKLTDATKAIAETNKTYQESLQGVTDAQDKVVSAQDKLSSAQDAAANAQQRVVDAQDRAAASADRIVDAQNNVKEAMNRVIDASDNIVKAQDDVASAANKVKEAENGVYDAMVSLQKAQSDAADSADAVKDAQDDAVKAADTLAEAQQALIDVNKDSNSTDAEKLKAQNAVKEAQLDLGKANRDVTAAQRDLAVSNAEVVSSGKDVSTAQSKVTESNDDLKEANLAVEKAQRDKTEAETAVVKSQKEVTAAQKASEKAYQDIIKAQKESEKAQQAVSKAQEDLKKTQEELSTAQKNAATAEQGLIDKNKDGKLSSEELEKALGLEEGALKKAEDKLGSSAGKMQEYADAQAKAIPASQGFNVWMEKLGISLGGVLQPFEGLISPLLTITGVLSGLAVPILGVQALAPILAAITGGGIITGLSALAGSIAATGAAMGAALIPVIIAAAPIIAGIGIALLVIYGLSKLGVFDWIIEQGRKFGDWIRAFDIGKAFQGVIDFFTNLPGTILKTVSGAGGGEGIAGAILKIIFPPLLILDLLNKAFPQIGEFFSGIGSKVLEFITGIDPNTIISAILAVIFPPSLILTALGVNWLEVGKWFLEIPGKVLNVISGVVADASAIAGAIFPVDKIGSTIQAGIDTALKVFDTLAAGWKVISDTIKSVWDTGIKLVFDALGAAAELVIKGVITYFGLYQTAWDILSAAFKTAYDTIIKVVWDALQTTAKTVVDAVKLILADLQLAWDTLSKAFQTIWDTILKPVWDALSTTATTVIDAIKILLADLSTAWEVMVTTFQTIWDETFKPLWDTLQSTIKGVVDIVGPYIDTLVSGFKTAIEWANKAIAKLLEFVGVKAKTGESASAATSNSSLASYATGTDYVPETGLYTLHKGEAVIPAAQNSSGSVKQYVSQDNVTVVLPSVTNYDEFKRMYAADMRTRNARRGVI